MESHLDLLCVLVKYMRPLTDICKSYVQVSHLVNFRI